MTRKFTFTILAMLFAILGPGAEAWGQTESVTYVFNSKDWKAKIGEANANWTSKKDGGQFTANQGIQVTKSGTGACGNSNVSYSNVSKIIVTYCTNKSSGAGSIKWYNVEATTSNAQSGTLAGSYTVTAPSSGGTTLRTCEIIPSSALTGFVQLYVECTTNSIYIWSVEIQYSSGTTPTVSAPTFNPAGGEYVGEQTVEISTETEDATIYYNFTGEEPWTEYTKPVTISQTSTLYAYATKTDCEDSEIVSAEYTISSTITLNAPALTITAGNAKVTPTWAAVEHASSYTIEYATNNEFTNSTTITNAVSGTEITGLTNETTYYFRIKSIGDGATYLSSDWGATVSAKPSSLITMSIDFEDETSAYTDWTFNNMTSKQTGSITAHGGTNYGTTGGKATASITTKNAIANPITFSCYVSKQTNNTSSSTWYIQVSEDGSNWDNVKQQSATSMDKGVWVEFSQDLSTYHNVYVRIYYSGSTATRNIDDLTLTCEPATYNKLTVATVENGTIAATVGSTTITEGSNDNVVLHATVTLTQQNDAGYGFGEWDVYKTDEPDTKVTVTDNSFRMPDYDVTVDATFNMVQTYAITIDGNIQNGIVTVDKTNAAEGETVEITATPNPGYFFGTWNVTYIDGDTHTVTVTDNTFSMPAFPVTVSATFIERPAATFTNGVYTESFASDFGQWITYNEIGDQVWNISNGYAHINGYSGGAKANIDWLISPKMTAENAKLIVNFISKLNYSNQNSSLVMKYSTNYNGTGEPTTATWNELSPTIATSSTDTNSGDIEIEAASCYVAFIYTSTSAGAGEYFIKNFNAKQCYTVTYNANNGSGEMTDTNSPYTVGAEVTTLKNTFTAPAATPNFAGWNTEADGTGYSYNEEANFNMPAENVILYAQWTATVVYTITVEESEYGTVESDKATAEAGETVTLTVTPNEHYQLQSITATPGEDVDITDEYTFVMPENNVTITATFEPIMYTVSFSVNDNTEILASTSVQEGSAIGTLPTPDAENIPTDFDFAGWSSSESSTATIGETYIVNADVTLYAVFSREEGGIPGSGNYEKVTNISDIISGEYIITATFNNTEYTMKNGKVSAKDLVAYSLESQNLSVENNAIVGNAINNSWTFTGTNNSMTITSTKETQTCYLYATNTNNGMVVGSTSDTWSFTAVDNTDLFYMKDSNHNRYLSLYNGQDWRCYENTSNGVPKLALYKKDEGTPGNTKYYTRVQSISGNTEITTVTTADLITVPNGAVLTITGSCTGDPENLIIEDGGQLIVNNKGVQATMKKEITGSTPSKASDVKWYTISSPLAADETAFADVTNLIPKNDVTNTYYDLYYLNEKDGVWVNARPETGQSSSFTTIDKGVGYIYHNNADTKLEFEGEINVASVNRELTKDAAHGFNLIGNPFMQNITLDNVDGTAELAGGFYVLTNQDTWATEPITTGTIAPLQGFLVQAKTAGNVTISKNVSSKGERSNEQNTNIEIIVSNGSYRDNAYAMFGEGIGLNKVSHRNAQAPMLYVPQGGEDFAIAMMDENVTLFPVSFKAMTTGNYSISLKATDDVSTLVLVDNMTGAETNMLLENSYSFVGSPRDSENRFTVKLKISNSQDEDEHFAYQNGSELVINGEGTLQIFDILGRVVVSEEVHGQTVNVGGLNTGAYIVRLTGESVKTQKIVVR